MGLNIPEIRTRFRQDQARYEAVAKRIREDCAVALQMRGIPAEVTSGPKTEASFLRKAIVKSVGQLESDDFDPFSRINDRAGVRIVVPHLEAALLARTAVRDEFIVRNDDDTRDRYAPDQLGYLGLHLEVELKAEQCDTNEQHLLGVLCEIQIHTRA